ncbi:MAG: hypothetical protein ACREBR_03915 [bacterium]
MGTDDPRLTIDGRVDFRLRRLLKSYARADDPPARVKPLPLSLLHHVWAMAQAAGEAQPLAVADMAYIGFFFLLRPSEYAGTNDHQAFRLQDIQLWAGGERLEVLRAPIALLQRADFATLTFTTQKNGVRGEVVGHGTSGALHACPTKAIVCRVMHLRRHGARPEQPLSSYWDAHGWHHLTSGAVTSALRLAAALHGPALGFNPGDVSARSLRSGGAMALMCADVPTDKIRLLGRWRSDEVLRYLHVQAPPVMQGFAQRMVSGGAFTLLPGQDVPGAVQLQPTSESRANVLSAS